MSLSSEPIIPKLEEWIRDYFDVGTTEGSYSYHLTRVKSGFSYGTVSINDFVPFEEDTVSDLAQFLYNKMKAA